MIRNTIAEFNWLIYQVYWSLEGQIEDYNDNPDLTFPTNLYKKMIRYYFDNKLLDEENIKKFQKSGKKIDFFYEYITLDKNVDWIQIKDRKKSILSQGNFDDFYIKAGLFLTYGYKKWVQFFSMDELKLIYIVLFAENIDNLDITALQGYLEKRKMEDTIKEIKDLIKRLEEKLGCQNQQGHKRHTEKVEGTITIIYNRIGSAGVSNSLRAEEEKPDE